MILNGLLSAAFGASLIVSASIDRAGPLASQPDPSMQLSLQQKRAAIRPLVSSATECIARRVSADPRFGARIKTGNVNELIVDSVPSCLDAVRSMIDAYDRFFGHGAGETFFVGPYLDGLPAAVNALVRGVD
jgi:hypothetical protein